MMHPRDLWNVPHQWRRLRPLDLAQEIVAIGNMRFNFYSLLVGQRALLDAQEMEFLRGDQVVHPARHVGEVVPFHARQRRCLVLGQDARFIGHSDGLEPHAVLLQLGLEAPLDLSDLGGVDTTPLFALQLRPDLGPTLDRVEPPLDQVQLERKQLLFLYQDLLPYPTLPEVSRPPHVPTPLHTVLPSIPT